MPRDVNGNYTLPSGNPVVTGTVISSVWGNTTLSDLATAMTNSLDRTGASAGMTGQFKATSGSVTAPGITFGAELTTGFYRAGANDVRFTVAGTDRIKFGAIITTLPGTQVPDGAVGTPAYSWQSEPTSGWYRASAGNFRFSISGVDAVTITATLLTYVGGATISGAVSGGNFNVTANTIPSNGIYLSAANTLALSTAGVLRGSIGSTGVWSIPSATGGNPTIIFSSGATAGSSFLFPLADQTTYSILGRGGAGPGIVGRWDASTNNRFLQIGNYDGAGVFTPSLQTQNGVTSVTGAGTTFFTAGFLELPQNVQGVNYAPVLSDSGKHILTTTGAITYTIPANATLPFPIGTALTFANASGANITVTIGGTDTLAVAGLANGPRTLANAGVFVALKVGATLWLGSGSGVS